MENKRRAKALFTSRCNVCRYNIEPGEEIVIDPSQPVGHKAAHLGCTEMRDTPLNHYVSDIWRAGQILDTGSYTVTLDERTTVVNHEVKSAKKALKAAKKSEAQRVAQKRATRKRNRQIEADRKLARKALRAVLTNEYADASAQVEAARELRGGDYYA